MTRSPDPADLACWYTAAVPSLRPPAHPASRFGPDITVLRPAAGTTAFMGDTSFTVAAWVQPTDTAAAAIQYPCTQWNVNGPERRFWLQNDSGSQHVEFTVCRDFRAATARTGAGHGALQNGRWYRLVGVHRHGVGIELHVDGALVARTAWADGVESGDGPQPQQPWIGGISRGDDNYDRGSQWRGGIGPVLYAERAWTVDEIAWDYNGGGGRPYEALLGALPPDVRPLDGLVAFWPMTEEDDGIGPYVIRRDAHVGGHHLQTLGSSRPVSGPGFLARSSPITDGERVHQVLDRTPAAVPLDEQAPRAGPHWDEDGEALDLQDSPLSTAPGRLTAIDRRDLSLLVVAALQDSAPDAPWLHLSHQGDPETGLKLYHDGGQLVLQARVGGAMHRLISSLDLPAERLIEVRYRLGRLSLHENGAQKASVRATGGFDHPLDTLAVGPRQGWRELIVTRPMRSSRADAIRAYLMQRHSLPTSNARPPSLPPLPLTAESLTQTGPADWPTHAAVPWPRGRWHGRHFRLGVFDGRREVPSHEVTAQTWDAYGTDPRWTHLHFVSTPGTAYTVQAVKRSTARPRPGAPLAVTEDAASITIESPYLKAVVGKASFALLDDLQVDPSGRGAWVPVLHGAAGAEIAEGGRLLAARHDRNASVTVELRSPVHVIVKAEGLYRAEDQADSGWAAFTTRLHFWADTTWIRVVHNLGYRHDMVGHDYDHAALVFPFHIGERCAYAVDDDRRSHRGELAGDDDIYLHQERHDACRVGTDAQLRADQPATTGERSDNAWSLQGHGLRIDGFLRNGWQEFPFEVRLGRRQMAVSMQPWHGRESFGPLTDPLHVGEKELHKLRYAHTGPRQRQGLPRAYVDAFNTLDATHAPKETGETSADAAAGANWQGMMLRQDLYLRVVADAATHAAALDTAALRAMADRVQRRPIHTPPPAQVRLSQVFGPIGTIDQGWREVFDHVGDVIKGDYNAERGGYHGRFRWGAMPHHWDVERDRPNWHRLEYGDSHYDRIALIFWYFMATGDAELLAVARKAVKFHQCMRYVNYPSTLESHALMAQWHKGLTPCAYVTKEDATQASGHSVHAHSMLTGWLVDADRDQLDAYTRWASRPGHYVIADRDRNTNNMLHEAIQEHGFFHRHETKRAIRRIGEVLMSAPMATPVASDALWDRAWPLYLHLFGGPGVREYFERECAPGQWLQDRQEPALLMLCHRVTGDVAPLRRGLAPLRSRVLRSIFRAPSGRYSPGFWQDIYARPELHKSLLHYLHDLGRAGITEVPQDDGEPGQYPIGVASASADYDIRNRGAWIALHNPSGAAFTLRLGIGAVGGGDRHPVGVLLTGPDGSALPLVPTPLQGTDGTPRMRPSGWSERVLEVPVPAQPAGGLYGLFLASSQAALFAPSTVQGLPEAAVIRQAVTELSAERRRYRATLTRMHLMPLTTAHPIDWTFRPQMPDNGCRIRITDAGGHAVLDTYLMRNEPGHEQVTVRMNGPGGGPVPWLIDAGSTYEFDAASDTAIAAGIDHLALMGVDLHAMRALAALIPARGP